MPHGAAYTAVGVNAPHTRLSLGSWQLPLRALGDGSEVVILPVPSSSSLPLPGEAVLELHHSGRDPAWPVQVASLSLTGGSFDQKQKKNLEGKAETIS